MHLITKTEYALEHLQELHDILADRRGEKDVRIPKQSFAIASQFLKAIGESAISVIREPEFSAGDFGELLIDWEPPKVEIHLVIRDGIIYGDAYLSTGTEHADNFEAAVKLIHLAAGV
jgi:hypothetical protein